MLNKLFFSKLWKIYQGAVTKPRSKTVRPGQIANRATAKVRVGKIKLTVRYSVILVVVFGLVAALVVSSLFKAIIAGLVTSYIFYPLYRIVHSRLRMRTVSALLVTIFVLALLTVPSYYVAKQLLTEVPTAFVVTKQYLEGGKASECEKGGLCQLVPKNIKNIDPNTKALLTSTLGKGTEIITNKIRDILLTLPTIFLHLFIMFFIMYYTFKDGKTFVEKLKAGFPLQKHRQDALIGQFNRVVSAVIYGTVVVAVLQAVLAGIGFYLFGIPSPIIWAIVTLFVSLIPFLGPFVVWLPASVLLMLNGYYSGDNLFLLRGIGLFLYGLLVVSGIDNVLKPRIIAQRTSVHPALVLVGIIGGINFLGVVGFIIGPVVIAMLVTAYETYLQGRSEEKPEGQL